MLAFALTRSDTKENDQIIAFYTKEVGKIELLARGVKKIISKNAPALEPFSLLEIEVIPGKNQQYVAKAQIIESYLRIRESFEKIMAAGYIINFVKSAAKNNEPDHKIFNLLQSFFKLLDSSPSVQDYFLPAFVGRLVCFLGFTPILTKCTECSSQIKKMAIFSVANGGVVCEDCAAKGQISGAVLSVNEIKGLHSILSKNWLEITKSLSLNSKELAKIFSVIKAHTEYHLSVRVEFPKFE